MAEEVLYCHKSVLYIHNAHNTPTFVITIEHLACMCNKLLLKYLFKEVLKKVMAGKLIFSLKN